MTLIYENKEVISLLAAQSSVTTFAKTFNRLYKFRFLIPIFPKWNEAWDKYWYKDSFIMVYSFTLFFYLIALFFVYLGIADRGHMMDFLLVGFGWVLVGLIIPAGLYRLIIYILEKKHLVS